MLIDRVGDKYIIKITDATITETESKNNDSIIVQGSYKLNYIASVNTQYIIHDSTKTLDPAVLQDRRNVWYHLDCSGFDRHCVPNDCKLIVEFGFYLNHSINSRDLDNMIKSNLDTIAQYFNFNDNRVYNLAVYKRLLLNSEKELVHFRIKKFENENNTIDNRLLK